VLLMAAGTFIDARRGGGGGARMARGGRSFRGGGGYRRGGYRRGGYRRGGYWRGGYGWRRPYWGSSFYWGYPWYYPYSYNYPDVVYVNNKSELESLNNRIEALEETLRKANSENKFERARSVQHEINALRAQVQKLQTNS
jgi:hypothetical protein